MSCKSKCHFTAALDGPHGRRLMVSQGGKYPAGKIHPMCDECVEEMRKEAEIALLFNNDQKLIARYKKVMGLVK